MANPANMKAMGAQLHFYDVIQGGWEHEDRGPRFNVHHVLAHLVRTVAENDFSDSEQVRSIIAPDSIFYSIRLARWSGGSQMILDRAAHEKTGGSTFKFAQKLGTMPVGFESFVEAAGVLAKNAHDMDHVSTLRDALALTNNTQRYAAGLLAESAANQAQEYNFDLFEAFSERLLYLRNRFGLPHH